MRLRDVLASPLAPGRLRAQGWAWLVGYLLCCGLVLGTVALLILRHERDALELLLSYVLPESWRLPGRILVERLFTTQEREIVINAAVGGGLALVSLLLFPVKEKLSAAFERDAALTAEPGRGFPLLVEAREELKLFLFFLAAQGCIFWLGYSPDPTRRAAALTLSYLTVAMSYAMDFLTPILQRHEVRFSTAAKALARRPVSALAFGALYAAPAVVAGILATRLASWSLGRTLALIFVINVVAIAWAAVAGTAVGARLLPEAQATRRPSAGTRALVWLLLLAGLGFSTYRFVAVGRALHRKTALLRCTFDVNWGSARFDMPSLLSTKLEVGVELDVGITNPTSRTVAIEENRLELRHEDTLVAATSLPVVEVPAGATIKTRARFRLALTPQAALKGRELLSRDGYSLTLWLDVAPGFELPVFLF